MLALPVHASITPSPVCWGHAQTSAWCTHGKLTGSEVWWSFFVQLGHWQLCGMHWCKETNLEVLKDLHFCKSYTGADYWGQPNKASTKAQHLKEGCFKCRAQSYCTHVSPLLPWHLQLTISTFHLKLHQHLDVAEECFLKSSSNIVYAKNNLNWTDRAHPVEMLK